MSELRLNLIDAQGAIHGKVHGGLADALIASLSAEPETIAELEAALDRFNKRSPDCAPLSLFEPGENCDHWDTGVIVVDLAARIIASETTCIEVLSAGEVNYLDGNEATDIWLPYRLPDDWLLLTSVLEYESVRDEKRETRKSKPLLDIRHVLYGRRLIEFIVSECLTEYENLARLGELEVGGEQSEASEFDDVDGCEGLPKHEAVLRSVHAKWLITPRDDLGERAPRDVILDQLHFLESDIEFRAVQWSRLRESPPPLSRDSAAYRFAGFGTFQYVIYYNLVRHLLRQCWRRISGEVPSGPSRSDSGDSERVETSSPSDGSAHLADQVERLIEFLEQAEQAWLNSPCEEFEGRIPAEIIDSERRRIPLAESAKESILDPHCPLCRMMIDEDDGFSPMFWFLDGGNMDEGFEFSDCQTREEWESEQRHWQEFNKEFEKEWASNHPPCDEIKTD